MIFRRAAAAIFRACRHVFRYAAYATLPLRDKCYALRRFFAATRALSCLPCLRACRLMLRLRAGAAFLRRADADVDFIATRTPCALIRQMLAAHTCDAAYYAPLFSPLGYFTIIFIDMSPMLTL